MEGVRKRFTSPIIRVEVSNWPGVRGPGAGAGDLDVLDEEVGGRERGRQAMNVSLSASVRQLRCIAYSSSRVRGSEAVSAWICWGVLMGVLVRGI